MKRHLPAVMVACCALLLAAGCGSSGTSSSSSSTTATTSSVAGGLNPNTTPKYASPSPSAPLQSGVVQIAYRNIAIDPDTIRVKVGSTIQWTNYDSIEHNVTSKGGGPRFASNNFSDGGTYEIKATKPGLIPHTCTSPPTA